MSTDLDTRAREAARHLRTLVGDANLTLAQPDGRRFRPGSQYPMWGAAAGVLVAALAGFWLLDPLPSVGPAQDPMPTSTVTSTAPGPVVTVPTTVEPKIPPTTEGTPPTSEPADTTAPSLIILHPVNGQVFELNEATFEGTTDVGARVFAGPYEADVRDDGSWQIALILGEGQNRVGFTAHDDAGNVGEASVSVVYKPAPPETTTTKPEVAAFDANFTWGECSIDPPFDEYFGVGQPGSKVFVESEYGSGSTVIGESGEWYLKVVFPTAPPGQTFATTVSDQFGRSEIFEFTSTVVG